MSTTFIVLTLLFLAVAVAMILLILVQRPQGGGLAGAFGGAGGGGTDTAFGGRTGDVLTLATVGAFSVFLLLAIVINITGNPRAMAGSASGETATSSGEPGTPGLVDPDPDAPLATDQPPITPRLIPVPGPGLTESGAPREGDAAERDPAISTSRTDPRRRGTGDAGPGGAGTDPVTPPPDPASDPASDPAGDPAGDDPARGVDDPAGDDSGGGREGA